MLWHCVTLKHNYGFLYISLDLKVFQEYPTFNLFLYLSINYLVINNNDFLYIPYFICQKINYINDRRILNMRNCKLGISKFFSFQKNIKY